MREVWARVRGLRRPHASGSLDVAVTLDHDGIVRIDHACPAAGMHRLLGVEPTAGERAALGAGGEVAIVVRCDRCPWERRLLLRAG